MKKLLTGLMVFMLIGIIGNVFVGDTDKKPATSSPDIELTDKNVTTENRDKDKDKNNKVLKQAIVEEISNIYDGLFDYCDVSFDEASDLLTVSVANDGVAMSAMFAKGGEKTNYVAWCDMTKAVDANCVQARDIFKDSGFKTTSVCINILNDQNLDNVLYTTLNGIGIYSSVE